MGKKKKRQAQCAYCGIWGQVTDDHVIPQCLFNKPLPKDIVLIPACAKCNNNDKSKDDEYLRDYLVTDIHTSNHHIAQSIFHSKFLSAVRQNKSALAREVTKSASQEPFYSKGGIYLGEAVSGNFDGERMRRIFCRITHGLYFKVRRKRIPDSYVCRAERWTADDFNKLWPKLQEVGFNGPYECGDVFRCIMLYADEDEFITTWWLWFYDQMCIRVVIAPEGFDLGKKA